MTKSMKRLLIICAMTCLLPLTGNGQENPKEYLNKVLDNLNTIQSAAYLCHKENFQPGDTLPLFTSQPFYREMAFPQDTTVGYVLTIAPDKHSERLNYAYDGYRKYDFFPDKKGVIIDDYTYRPSPFRIVASPFFHFCREIISYTLNTTDNIRFEIEEEEDCYHFKLTIDEDTQVEFIGKVIHMPKSPFYVDPLSIYEIWISKENDLPYKIKRNMSHDINTMECIKPEFNKLAIQNFNIIKYIPADYEIRTKEENDKKTRTPSHDLTGQPAPPWTLNDGDSQPISLNDFKSKVLVICITGVGCGACQAAVPFLKELKSHYQEGEVELVAFESWSRRETAVKAYKEKKQLNYTILVATDQTIKDYQTNGSAPWFFILDEQRVIQKAIRGYGGERTNKEITDAITTILTK